jgi:putative transposase
MPWKEVLSMDQKTQFVSEYLRDTISFAELCDRYQISRKTGYKWINRYQAEGPSGLADRSRRPHSSPEQTPEAIRLAIIEARRRHPTWGAKKLLKHLGRKDPQATWPSRWTVCEILRRAGLVRQRTRRRKPGHPGKPASIVTSPNDLWWAHATIRPYPLQRIMQKIVCAVLRRRNGGNWAHRP